MGSYTVVGCQSLSSLTSAMIALARSGEQMKWMMRGRASRVPTRSRGVIRILGVRYSNLCGTSVSYCAKAIEGLPEWFERTRAIRPGRSFLPLPCRGQGCP